MIRSQTPSSLLPTYFLPVIHTKRQYLAVYFMTAFQKENLLASSLHRSRLAEKKSFANHNLTGFELHIISSHLKIQFPGPRKRVILMLFWRAQPLIPQALFPSCITYKGKTDVVPAAENIATAGLPSFKEKTLAAQSLQDFFFSLQVIHLTFVQVNSTQRLLPSSA